jgi:Cu-processing system permease protein
MNAIWVIALNAFRQTMRQRLFYNVAVFGIGMMLLSMVVGNLTFGYPDRVVRSIGLSGVSIALNLVGLLVGVGLIHQEIDKKTLFVVLTRPVRTWQYVLGRYLGLVLTLFVAAAGLSVVFLLTLVSSSGTPAAQDFLALIATIPEAAILGGLGIVLSSFSTPTLSAGIGIGMWIACSALDDFVRLAEKAQAQSTATIARVVSYILPNLSRFNFREVAIYQSAPPFNEFFFALAYGGLYALALVALASAILSRREMI